MDSSQNSESESPTLQEEALLNNYNLKIINKILENVCLINN